MMSAEPTSIEQAVLDHLRGLAPAQQQQVLDFVKFLQQQYPYVGPRKSLKGLWAGRGIDLSEEEIDAARREMWSFQPAPDEVRP